MTKSQQQLWYPARGNRPNGPFAFNRASPQAYNLLAWFPLAASQPWTGLTTGQSALALTRVAAPVFIGDPALGMAPQFNGTTQAASVAIDLSAYAKITVTMWLYWDAFGAGNNIACEYGNTSETNSGFLVIPSHSAGAFLIGIGMPTPRDWQDSFPRPSAAAWHHYAFGFDRATPANTALVDGVLQTLTTITHGAATYGNFGNTTLYLMSRATTSLFGAGRIVDLRIYSGLPTAQQAWDLYDPATRWDLYRVPSSRTFFDMSAAFLAQQARRVSQAVNRGATY